MGTPSITARTDLNLAILRLLDDGRERTSSEISERLREKYPEATPVRTAHHMRRLHMLGLVKAERICYSNNVMGYRKANP